MRADPLSTGVKARPRWKPVGGRDVALGDGDEARQAGLGGEEIVVVRIEPALGNPVADGEELARRVVEEAETPWRKELGGALCEVPERPASSADGIRPGVRPAVRPARGRPRGPGRGLRPGRAQLRPRRAPRSRPRHRPPCPARKRAPAPTSTRAWKRALQIGEPRRHASRAPLPGRGHRRGEERSERRERLVELPPGDRLGRRPAEAAPLATSATASRSPASVWASNSGRRSSCRRFRRAPGGGRQGYRCRRSRCRAARAGDGFGCRTSCKNDPGNASRTFIVPRVSASRRAASTVPSQPKSRARRRQQVESQVGRRGAVGDDRPGILLKVVGRERMVLRPDEGLEEAPGATGRSSAAPGPPRWGAAPPRPARAAG